MIQQEKIAVILFNLGGPDRQQSVQPFLFNLFSDPAIIRLPQPFRWLIAKLISARRAPAAREIYAQIGGGSPIVAQTENQARALEQALEAAGFAEVKCFVAMRYWHPRASAVISQVKSFNPDHLVLLPLYPQFSTTTTQSSLAEWHRLSHAAGITAKTHEIGCFPDSSGFVESFAELIRKSAPDYFGAAASKSARLLFSAHGLPQRIVDAGDPYPGQIARSAQTIANALGLRPDQWEVSYQSRVGPLKWIGPSTEERIRAAGAAKAALVLVPIAFVSEHSETLVELDIEYKHLADVSGVTEYVRVPTPGVQTKFIHGLAGLIQTALAKDLLCGQPDAPVCCRVGSAA